MQQKTKQIGLFTSTLALLMVGATIAASCAFMLPVATPPNEVVFALAICGFPIWFEWVFR